ncbi:ATP-binding protein [Streptomyces sp. NPDC002536]
MPIHPQRSDRRLTMDLTLRPAELAEVRRIVRAQLHYWNLTAQADDVVTVVNELLTNVVDHVPGARCKLVLEHKAHLLHVRVSDNHRAAPVKQRPNIDRTTGRGLALIDGLTHGCWNVATTSPGEGKEVHCLFDTSQAAPRTETVNAADIVHEIFRYGNAYPGRLTDVLHYTPRACDHLATGRPCNHNCLTVTIGSVVRSATGCACSAGR